MIGTLSLVLALADGAVPRPNAPSSEIVPKPDSEILSVDATQPGPVPVPDSEVASSQPPSTGSPAAEAEASGGGNESSSTSSAPAADAEASGDGIEPSVDSSGPWFVAGSGPHTGEEAEASGNGNESSSSSTATPTGQDAPNTAADEGLQKPAPASTPVPAVATTAEAAPEQQTCPSHTSASTDGAKYPCGYTFGDNDAVQLYIGRDATNVYIKATTSDARWVAVGPSTKEMGNLSAVVNHDTATTEGKGGARYIDGTAKGHDETWPEPVGDKAFKGTPSMSKSEQGRVIELVFDAATWESDAYNSGLSIAWGTDANTQKVAYHGPNREFLTFNGTDEKYALPGSGAAAAAGDDELGADGTPDDEGPVANVVTTTLIPDGPGEPEPTGDDDPDSKDSTSSFHLMSVLLLMSFCF